MVETHSSQLKIRYIIILALLINSGIIILFFFNEFCNELLKFPVDHSAPVIFEQMAPKSPEVDLQDKEIAALKARASVFGATDQEQDEAEFTQGTTDSASIAEESSGVDIQLGDTLFEGQQNNVSPVQEIYDQDVLPDENKKMLHEQPESIQEAQLHAVQVTKNGASRVKIQELQNDETKDSSSKVHETQKTAQKNPVPNTRSGKLLATKNNTGNGTKNAGPIKRQLTFADLARGFLESHEHSGQDWLNRKGNENIRPDLEEMKYLSYLQKLYWHLQNIVKQSRFIMQPDYPKSLRTDLVLIVNRQGTIEHVGIKQSSGCSGFDYYCQSLFLNNTTGCPPIPNHLNQHSLMVPFSIILAEQMSRIRFSYH